MSSVLFCYPNYSDAEGVLFSAPPGAWVENSDVSLSNLADPRLAHVARSVNALPASTQFDVDLTAPCFVRAFSYPKHNLTTNAKVRVRGSNEQSGPRTNQAGPSEDFSSASWTKDNLTVAANVATAPDGTLTADRLTDTTDGSSVAHQMYQPGFNPISSGSFSDSFFVKRDNWDWIRVRTEEAGFVSKQTWFNLGTGTRGTTQHAAGQSGIEPVGDGWFRVWVATPANTAGNPILLQIVPSDGGTSYQGAASRSVLVWGAQLESGLFPSSYIKTTTVAVTRSTSEANFFAPSYSSGWVDVFPVIYASGSLPWGHPSFWTGRLAPEDKLGINIGFTRIAAAPGGFARYWRHEIQDAGNPDGYVELNRLVMAAAYQPSINILYGAGFGWETDSSATRSDGGVRTVRARPQWREVRGTLDIPVDEALSSPFDMQRQLGIHKQLLFVWDPDDTVHAHRRNFLAAWRELSLLEYARFDGNTVPFALTEVL
jgi:hypothetical protein